MSLEHAILGFLRERPMTGYDLKNVCFDESASHFWTADQSQVYRTLDRLETRRLVRAKRERQTSRPDRKIYSITDTGGAELDAWIARSDTPPPLRDPFLIRLRFAADLPDDDLLGLLRDRRDALQERLESLRVRSAEGSAEPRDRATLLHRLTRVAGATDVRAEIDWIDDSLELLEARIEQENPTPPGGQSRLFSPARGARGSVTDEGSAT